MPPKLSKTPTARGSVKVDGATPTANDQDEDKMVECHLCKSWTTMGEIHKDNIDIDFLCGFCSKIEIHNLYGKIELLTYRMDQMDKIIAYRVEDIDTIRKSTKNVEQYCKEQLTSMEKTINLKEEALETLKREVEVNKTAEGQSVEGSWALTHCCRKLFLHVNHIKIRFCFVFFGLKSNLNH
jgi:hypothetical protein